MKRRIFLAEPLGVYAAILALGTVPALAQETLPNYSAGDAAPTVMASTEAGDLLPITVGYSKLLQADQPLGTIIVGDDTIANAILGSGNSIILTGLSTGSTNIIVLGESNEVLISATISVSPLAGPLHSTATVLKGTIMRERYECRSTACNLVDPQDQPTEISSLSTPTNDMEAAEEGGASAE